MSPLDNFSRNRRASIRSFIDALQASGRYSFTREEAQRYLQASPIALKNALRRLSQAGRIVSPRRGFNIIVPLEYRAAGSLPPAWFVRDLMAYLKRPYYVGLLSAAALHGAAHQAPQELQVVTDRSLRPIEVGRNRIRFIKKADIASTPTVGIKAPTGEIRVSTSEATALDLVRYQDHAGHLANILIVLRELAERLNARALVRAAQSEPDLPTAQRLGYLLDWIRRSDLTEGLAGWVASRAPRATPLRPGRPITRAPQDSRWRVALNETFPGSET